MVTFKVVALLLAIYSIVVYWRRLKLNNSFKVNGGQHFKDSFGMGIWSVVALEATSYFLRMIFNF